MTWTRSDWRFHLARLQPAELAQFRLGVLTGKLALNDAAATELHGAWELVAREAQLPPSSDWRTWYVRGGRGSGKTRTGAETLARWIRTYLHQGEGDWGIIAPTFLAGRAVCIEGPSGLLRALGGEGGGVIRAGGWNRSTGEIHLVDETVVYLDGANDGAPRVQGKNLRGAWCDEVGLWENWDEAWNTSLVFAVRLEPGLIVATGTPKQGHGLVKQLIKDRRTAQTHMRMADNVANLSAATIDELRTKFEGTRRGRQELEGEFLEDVPGALWTIAAIEVTRLLAPAQLGRIVVGVDPSGSPDEDLGTSECGIIAAAVSPITGHGYVLADRSRHASPENWARAAVDLYHQLKADVLVAERNFGGEMVRSTIRAVDRNVNVKLVTASRGKRVRAEPIAALYEQGRVHHVGLFQELEEQQTTWVPDSGMDSPDRLDALVWTLTELMIEQQGIETVPDPSLADAPRVVKIGDMVIRGRDAEIWEDEPARRRR